ncbi:universal stress protein [Catelliglobosispora koreensis]|uniref:universal stress protein n=1 Tax=Catelliglobosispora koreensis TaxID=129052 RepID=UPI000361D84B|nr:universal stress protein [Catelliglobosispora koreensis]
MNGPVVAGVDTSAESAAAAHYAASLAVRRRRSLTLIHVMESFFHGYGALMFAPQYAALENEAREAAKAALAGLAAEIRTAHPALHIEASLRSGLPAKVLIAESEGALATVVGSRGLGGFTGLLLGSVSSQVAAHGHGPVIVMRPPADPGGPVLVAYDGSDAASAALDFAAHEALSSGRRLVVASVYWEQPWVFGAEAGEDPKVLAERQASELIKDGLEFLLEEHPGLQSEELVIHSLNPQQSLVEASARASLTVVGSRGLGGFTGLLLGSISRTLIHHGAGPIAVVHPAHV